MDLVNKIQKKSPKMILSFGDLRAVVYSLLPEDAGYDEETHNEVFKVESLWSIPKPLLDRQQSDILELYNNGQKIIEFPKGRFSTKAVWDKIARPIKPQKDYSKYTLVPLEPKT